MLYGTQNNAVLIKIQSVLILIFLENALRRWNACQETTRERCLNPYFFGKCSTAQYLLNYLCDKFNSLNPYFFGKCSTASTKSVHNVPYVRCLNPYFFGKCSTADDEAYQRMQEDVVLILIFLENALRRRWRNERVHSSRVLILIFLENALRRGN